MPRKIPTTLTPDQVAALLESSGTLRPVLVLILFTALRVGEVAALRWRSVELEGGSIKLAATPDWQPRRTTSDK